MANRKVLFGLLVLCLSIYLTECGRFGGGRSGGRSSSRGGSSWGKGWGGSSSGSSWSKPSSWGSGSSSSSWGSSGNHKPATSWNTGSSSGSNSWSKPSYSPSSGGSGSHGYPPSTGYSGTGSGSHSYPSGTGWSGSGSKTPPVSSGSGSHSYPSGTGYSGTGTGTHHNPSSSGNGYYNRPKNTYNTNSGYGGTHSYHYIPHSYYAAPQHVYITQYRDSGSRYSSILTGLTLYNMGRSHSYHDHYYYDDYYRHRYHSTGSSYNNNQQQSSYNRPNEDATCTLRIKENGNLEVLKIPCEIVSTFTEGGKKIESDTYVNHTVCTTTITSYKTSPSSNLTVSTTGSPINTNINANANSLNVTITTTANPIDFFAPNATVTNQPTNSNFSGQIEPNTGNLSSIIVESNKTDGNVFTKTVNTTTPTETTVNVTTCITTQNYTDPMSLKGGPLVDPSNMECSVDIRTKDAHFRNNVECKTLMEYSRMPEPNKEEKPLLPPREKLMSWLQKPPWWMSLFIAV